MITTRPFLSTRHSRTKIRFLADLTDEFSTLTPFRWFVVQPAQLRFPDRISQKMSPASPPLGRAHLHDRLGNRLHGYRKPLPPSIYYLSVSDQDTEESGDAVAVAGQEPTFGRIAAAR